MFDPKKILVLAPHTDDGELGCGGAIAKFIAQGKEVYYAAFCLCAKSLPANLPADTLANECKAALEQLGIGENNVWLYDYEVRELPAYRQRILDELLVLKQRLEPDLVMLPAASDIHQDHQTVHQEGIRAFKHATIAGYELPWNNFHFRTDLFITLTDEQVKQKSDALQRYTSQAHRHYMQEDFTHSLAKVRGVQANADFAEAFELYRMIC